MANGYGDKEIEKVVAVFKQYADALEKAIKLNQEFIKTGKMPSGFVEGAQGMADAFVKMKAAGMDVDKETRKWIASQKQLGNVFKREQRELERNVGLYNRIDRGVSKLQKTYRDLAIRKELNGKLTAQELVKLGQLEAKINKYDAALKKVDASMGRNQRNVGNYKSAFDSLGFSVAQITRESPAFINSMQTGFMAISNNIPTLVDEINKLRRANVALAAEGQPTVNVLKRLGGAIFSWQSLISAAIVALTILGPKLFDWAFGMTEAEKATEEANKAIEEQNKQLRENISLREKALGKASSVIGNPDRLRELTNSRAGLVELSERLKQLGIDNSEVIKDENMFMEDRKAIALNLIDIAKLENQLKLERNKQDEVEIKRQEIIKQFNEGKITAAFKEFEIKKLLNEVDSFGFTNTLELQRKLIALREENVRIISKTVEIKSKSNDESKKESKILDDTFGTLEKTLPYYEAIIKGLKDQQMQLSQTSEQWRQYQQQIDDFTGRYETLKRLLTGDYSAAEGTSAAEDLIDNIVGGFSPSKDDIKKAEDDWRDYFNTIVPIVQNSMRLIADAQKRAFQNQLINLEKEKDLAIKFAGDSATAKEEIERQYSERRAEIQRKQAEAEKKQAIFSIILNTAQAVVAASVKSLGLAIAVGALGAVQLAIAQSTPIPEFAEGVRGFGGGLAVVGDGGVNEIVRTPDGKVFRTPSRDTLVNLPKGSDVFKNEDEFNKELNNMLNNNNIFSSSQSFITKKELTKEDLSDVIGRLEKTIESKEALNISMDENGFSKYYIKKNAKRNILNNRVKFKGKSV